MRRLNQTGWIRKAAVFAVVAAPAIAWAQPQPAGPQQGAAPASASPANVDLIKKHYAAGRAAADAKNWAKAAEEFGKAYALNPLPQIAGNLAEAELHLGRHRDAAEHAEKFLREDKGALTEDKAAARQWLTDAKKKVVTLKITVEDPGVEVLIDGKSIGKTPLPPEVYVDPGKHTVEARQGAARDEATDTYQAGWTRVMKLKPKAAGAAPGPSASATGTAVATGTVGSGTATTRPAVPAQSGGTPTWLRPAVLIGGGAVALVGIGIGIGGMAISAEERSARDAVCPSANCPKPGESNYPETKEKWSGHDAARVSNWNMGIAGFVVGGIAAAATGIAFFVWKPSVPKSDKLQGITLVPAGTGIMVKGTW